MAEIVISNKLEMTYGTSADTKTRYSLKNPITDLDAETVSTAMEVIVGKEVLQDSKGNPVTSSIGARILKTTEQVLF